MVAPNPYESPEPERREGTKLTGRSTLFLVMLVILSGPSLMIAGLVTCVAVTIPASLIHDGLGYGRGGYVPSGALLGILLGFLFVLGLGILGLDRLQSTSRSALESGSKRYVKFIGIVILAVPSTLFVGLWACIGMTTLVETISPSDGEFFWTKPRSLPYPGIPFGIFVAVGLLLLMLRWARRYKPNHLTRPYSDGANDAESTVDAK